MPTPCWGTNCRIWTGFLSRSRAPSARSSDINLTMPLIKYCFDHIRHSFSPTEVQTFSFHDSQLLFSIWTAYLAYQNALARVKPHEAFQCLKYGIFSSLTSTSFSNLTSKADRKLWHFLFPDLYFLFSFNIQSRKSLSLCNFQEKENADSKT